MWKPIFVVLIFATIIIDAVEPKQVKYYLFTTTAYRDYPYFLKRSNFTALPLDKTHELKIFFHGFGENGWNPWIYMCKFFYFHLGIATNFIIVDYSDYAGATYKIAYAARLEAANVIGKDLSELLRLQDFDLRRVHMIGMSLGGQMAGLVGQILLKESGSLVGRITGLDPAGVFFMDTPTSNRLDSSDAIFVDVIHTSKDAGYYKKAGHADFWPNGGTGQPTCFSEHPCDHYMAVNYFMVGLGDTNFTAWKCSSYEEFQVGACEAGERTVMGEYADTRSLGNYYLKTTRDYPFACNC